VDKTHQKRRAAGVAQDVDTEFKPQYCKKEKKKILFLKEPLVGMLVVQLLLSSGLCILGQSFAWAREGPLKGAKKCSCAEGGAMCARVFPQGTFFFFIFLL
jgi:hypothetical protein